MLVKTAEWKLYEEYLAREHDNLLRSLAGAEGCVFMRWLQGSAQTLNMVRDIGRRSVTLMQNK